MVLWKVIIYKAFLKTGPMQIDNIEGISENFDLMQSDNKGTSETLVP